jgi:Mn-dependent DtxR family transcriptional regulator
MRVASELNPDALRRPQAKNKVCSDKDFVEAVITTDPKAFKTIAADAASCLKMSKRSVTTYLARLTAAGLISTSAGVYWRPK